jgi:hypothetical protein
VATLLVIVTTSNHASGFNWLIGSTALTSKLYDVAAIAVNLPALVAMARLGRFGRQLPGQAVSSGT